MLRSATATAKTTATATASSRAELRNGKPLQRRRKSDSGLRSSEKLDQMGWLWSSSPSKASYPAATTTTDLLVDEGVPHAPLEVPLPEPVKVTLTREEQSDQELITWLKGLQAEVKADKQRRVAAAADKAAFATSAPELDGVSPDSLYPTEMSCRSAFDYAIYCQSFGGQFSNVYRYGTFRSCSNHWDDFWLCMRTRTWKEIERKQAIKDHYQKRAVKYKTGPSSEDVWEVRTEPVQDAFQGNFELVERRVEEWKKANPGKQPPVRIM